MEDERSLPGNWEGGKPGSGAILRIFSKPVKKRRLAGTEIGEYCY